MPATEILELLEPIKKLHGRIRDAVVDACQRASLEALSGVALEDAGDTIYAVDRISEHLILESLEREAGSSAPFLLVAEGLEGGRIMLPRGRPETDAVWRIIADPIDGTRGLMYQKRSAWILTGVAPNRGSGTGLQDIELAVQTEIPLVKQHLSDVLWAIRNRGGRCERYNRLTREYESIILSPSTAPTIHHGFATVARFFPGGKAELAAIDEEIVREAIGPGQPGKAACFEDQYISTGGQLYELIAGHDRFVADLRPLLGPSMRRQGQVPGLCCHPYDLCTEMIAREMGVIVADPFGGPIRAPLAVEPDIAWVGYANDAIRGQIEPLLCASLERRGFRNPGA